MHIVVLITAANKKEAKKIANLLLKNRLAPCVNIIDKIDSLFYWDGKINSAQETLLIVKSRKDKFSKLVKLVKANHSYQVPEIISLPVTAGLASYLRWWDDYIR
ncbi:MAG: divalent-cation tolerance protein CutA [Candidatus Omnitrophota bacterium]|jgi:periplasmic divalent cation tolerance protein